MFEPKVKDEQLSEQQKAILALSKYFIEEFSKNVRPEDKKNKTNPIEVVLRSAIRHVVNILGDNATAEAVATGLYEVLHVGDNITFVLTHRVLLSTADRRHKPKVL